MTRQEMVAAVEGEISRLEQVRQLLQNSTSEKFTAPAGNSTRGASSGSGTRQKRTMSPEARHRIALAQKKRWAKQKREANAAGRK